MTDQQAVKYGFDRKGPGKRVGNGFMCECYWASAINGNYCPEHGVKGEVIGQEPKTAICPECDGEGHVDDTGEYVCPICNGSQVIEVREGDEHGN